MKAFKMAKVNLIQKVKVNVEDANKGCSNWSEQKGNGNGGKVEGTRRSNG